MAQRKKEEIESSVIIQIIEKLFVKAIEINASDIHFEPDKDNLRIRFRIDGILREIESHPISLLEPLVSRLKILAEMDIAEHRLPQDGRIQTKIGDKEMDIRVSTFPTFYGENVALRLLDKSTILMGLEHLGFEKEALAKYESMIKRPYGIIFVTGPNGSGKTTTLYSTLNKLNSVEKNIVTLEDPIEYELPLIRQTQIDPEIGLTFASGLRSLLRQDPDIIMVGEIRDTDTGEIAIRSALTGHLVLTTLHTNDSVGALARLSDMGVESVLIASATIGVVAQRLIRTVCNYCAKEYEAPKQLLEKIGLGARGKTVFKQAVGCEKCGSTGFLGRMGIFEVLVIDDELRSLIVSGASYETIATVARKKGMKTLRDDGIAKALKGLTTIEEVFRVTSSEQRFGL
jgi:type II secretory ATPase GspE/PulE/Tfp pilus assembly ATPase PilB-like protein